jgi:cation:H+ antiporter
MDAQTWFLLIAGLALLIVGGELLVRGASRLAGALGVPAVVIGLTVVAFGTSAPELAVSLDAALRGNADIALSNVVGSNIFNLLFILGVSALISPLIIHSQMIQREVPVMVAVAAVLYFMSFGGILGRIEGILLIAACIAYTGWLVKEALSHKRENRELELEAEKEFAPSPKGSGPILASIGFVIVGLAVIMFGADYLVEGAVKLARSLGVSDTVIGLTIVAAGTSLPEVVASIIATIKGERDIAVGNVVGSNIYNIVAIAGITASLTPGGLSVAPQLLSIDMPFMIAASVVCFAFFWTGKKLSRLEGLALLLMYVGYTTYLVMQAQAA